MVTWILYFWNRKNVIFNSHASDSGAINRMRRSLESVFRVMQMMITHICLCVCVGRCVASVAYVIWEKWHERPQLRLRAWKMRITNHISSFCLKLNSLPFGICFVFSWFRSLVTMASMTLCAIVPLESPLKAFQNFAQTKRMGTRRVSYPCPFEFNWICKLE